LLFVGTDADADACLFAAATVAPLEEFLLANDQLRGLR